MELIELRNIYKTYQLGDMDVPVLKGVSVTVARGELVALMGASGSGKSTLMNILGCLDRPTSGEYWLDGENVSSLSNDQRALVRNHKFGFVFQNFNLLPRTSALENVAMPLSYTAGHLSDRQALQQAREMLRRVGLEDRMDHEPSQLSGGQQQRVAIARALVNHPPLIFADEPTGNLDSRTSEEVLSMFEQLNAQDGITIIIVTHDAARGEARPADHPPPRRPGRRAGLWGRGRDHHAAGGAGRGPMKIYRTARTAFTALRRNPMRALLTTLGIVIGVGAVIAMMEIGAGSSAAIQKTIATMGANVLLVLPGTAASGGVSFGSGSVTTLTPEDGEAILRDSPAVRSIAPIVRARTQVVYGNRNWVPQQMIGTTAEFLDIRDWSNLAEGDTFTERDVLNANKVCLIGQTLARELFQGESPVGKEIRVKNVTFRVVGVLSAKGANMMGSDQDDILLTPWTTLKYRVTGSALTNPNQSAAAASSSSVNTLNKLYPSQAPELYPKPSDVQAANTPLPVRFANIDQILAAARSTEEIPAAIQQITDVMRERHRIRDGQPDDFTLRDMTEMTNTLSSTTRLMTNLLLAVAMISLVVGGVGIMNIMLVSVTERTREIGLRMAVGARARDILRQFLVEAVVLCLVGGSVGILLGHGGSRLVELLLRWPVETSPVAIAAAVLVSAGVGIIFGFYPAWKASQLDPIDALRYE